MFDGRMNYEMQNEDKERLRVEEMDFMCGWCGLLLIGRKS